MSSNLGSGGKSRRLSRAVGAVCEALEQRLQLAGHIALTPTPTPAPADVAAPPTNVTATPDHQSPYGGIDVSWTTASADDDLGVVYVAPHGTGKFVEEIFSESPAPISVGIWALQTYDIYVVSVNEQGASAPSKIVTATAPLAPPQSLSASPVSSNDIVLHWQQGDDPAFSTEIDRSDDGGLTFRKLTVLPKGTFTYNDNTVAEGKDYIYSVRAIIKTQTSAFGLATFSGSTPPLAPWRVAAAPVNTNEIDIHWTNRSQNAQGLSVFRSDNDGVSYDWIADVGPTATSYADTSVSPGTTYKYYVASWVSTDDAYGQAYSNPSNIVTVATPPAGVANVYAFPASDKEVDLSFAVIAPNPAGVDVYESTNGTVYKPLTFTPLAGSASSFNVTGLKQNTHYYFELRVHENGGGVTAFTPIDAYTLTAAPTKLKATIVGLRGITLSWTNNSGAGSTFEIDRADNGSTDFQQLATTTATSFQDTFADPGDVYQYRVESINSVYAPSLASNIATATETAPFPGYPVTTFGNGGVTGEVFPGGSFGQFNTQGLVTAVALQPNGKILAAGIWYGLPAGGYMSSSGYTDSPSCVLARFNADGSLDQTFGYRGELTGGVTQLFYQITAMAVQPDGKILIAGDPGQQPGQGVVVARCMPNGTLDTTFGVGGFQVYSQAVNSLTSLTLLASGKILLVGDDGFEPTMCQLLSDGKPDASFGNQGVVSVAGELGSQTDIQQALAQPDGRILLTGDGIVAMFSAAGVLDKTFGQGKGYVDVSAKTDAGSVALTSDGDILVGGTALIRLTPSGAIDPSFHTQTTNPVTEASVFAQPNGDIVMVGVVYERSNPVAAGQFVMTRVTADGAYTSSYSSNSVTGNYDAYFCQNAAVMEKDGGILSVGFSTNFTLVKLNSNLVPDHTFGYYGFVLCPGNISEGPSALALQSDGKIVSAGAEQPPRDGDPADAAIVRYNADGTLDTSFGNQGFVRVNVGAAAMFDSLAIESNGDIVAGGCGLVNGVNEFLLARFLPDGALDASFGSGGIVLTSFGDAAGQTIANIGVESNGDIIAAGSTSTQLAVACYRSNGSLDTTFAKSGTLLLNPDGGGAVTTAMTLQASGKILLAFTTNTAFGVVRLTTAGAVDKTFGDSGIATAPIVAGDPLTSEAIAIDPSGNIVVVGYGSGGTILARWLANGTLDKRYGTDGVITDSGDIYGPLNIAIERNGDVVVGAANGSIARFTDSGLDATFGNAGVAQIDAVRGYTIVAVAPNGDILAGVLGLYELHG